MLGNTLTVEFGNSSFPNPQVLPKVNQDGYSSEYRKKDFEKTYSLIIRHSTEKNKVGGLSMERHQVLVRTLTTPTEVYPQGILTEAYIIVRAPSSASPESLGDIVSAVASVATANAPAIANWES